MTRLLLNNYQLKIFSVLMALGLWWYVYLQHHPTIVRSVRVPITFTGMPMSHAVVGAPLSASVRIRGSRDTVDRFDPSTLIAEVPAKDLPVGAHNVRLLIRNRGGSQVIGGPYHQNIRIIKLDNRRMKVHIVFSVGFLAKASIVYAVSEPGDVTIYGRSADLDRVSQIAAPIDMAGKNRSFHARVPIYAQDAYGNMLSSVRLAPSSVRVNVEVKGQPARRIPIIPRFTRGSEPGGSLEPSSATVSGPADIISSLKSIDTLPIDTSSCTSSPSFQVRVSIPDDIITDISQVTFHCPKPELTRITVPLEIMNVAPNLTATLEPSDIEVSVSSPDNKPVDIRPQDITAVVDLLDLSPGAHSIKPLVHLKEERGDIRLTYRPLSIRVNLNEK